MNIFYYVTLIVPKALPVINNYFPTIHFTRISSLVLLALSFLLSIIFILPDIKPLFYIIVIIFKFYKVLKYVLINSYVYYILNIRSKVLKINRIGILTLSGIPVFKLQSKASVDTKVEPSITNQEKSQATSDFVIDINTNISAIRVSADEHVDKKFISIIIDDYKTVANRILNKFNLNQNPTPKDVKMTEKAIEDTMEMSSNIISALDASSK